MLNCRVRALILAVAVVPALAGCQPQFVPTRSDPTPFAAADSDCWDHSGNVAPDDTQPRIYAKCMARHGWASCGPRGRCGRETAVW